MANNVTPWAPQPWDVSNGEHYSTCQLCDYEVSTFEQEQVGLATSDGTVQVRHFQRINAGEVRDLQVMPRCTGRD